MFLYMTCAFKPWYVGHDQVREQRKDSFLAAEQWGLDAQHMFFNESSKELHCHNIQRHFN